MKQVTRDTEKTKKQWLLHISIIWLTYIFVIRFFSSTIWYANPLGQTANCPSQYASCNTQIRVNLYNSYSWMIKINTGFTSHWIVIGNQLRAWTSSIIVDVSATASCDYILSWSDNGTTGAGLGIYTNSNLTPLNQEKIYLLQALYNSNGEFLRSNTVSIGIDLSPPSIPMSSNIPNDTTVTTPIIGLQRTDSIDVGVWLYGYLVYISLNPSFAGAIPLFTTSHFISILWEDLPRATIFYKIVAVDHLGHRSSSSTYYFHHHERTHVVLPWWSAFVPQDLTGITWSLIANTQQTGNIVPLKRTISPKYSHSKDTIYTYVFQDITYPEQVTVARKYFYQYLIDNFLQYPVKNRILPKMLPKNGADRTLFLQAHPEIVPLSETTIQEIIVSYQPNPQVLIQIIIYLTLLETLYWIISFTKTTK